MTAGRPPLIVVDAADRLDATADRLRSDGWRIADDLRAPPLDLARTVVRGVIDRPELVEAAVLVAAWGGGLLVAVDGLAEHARHRLLDDLGRIGPVDRSSAAVPLATDPAENDGLRLLELIAEGRSLGEAARELSLSRRTADRRLAAARGALGVESTTAAIAALSRRRSPRP